jgi:putative phosphoribosyl transferase
MFEDRQEAGELLSERLSDYKKDKNAIVIGLPRGGVVVAYVVAKKLDLPLDIVVPRKVGAPGNKELAIGAITVDGEKVLDREIISMFKIKKEYLDQEIENEKKEAERRLKLYRKGRPPLDLHEKTAILVDDGVATGSTMIAAIKSVQAKGAKKIVVAIPVSPPEFFGKVKDKKIKIDEIICLQTPGDFAAVGAYFKKFDQVEDDEVVRLLSAQSSPSLGL